MANPVLKGQVFKQTAVQFGSALVIPFEQVALTGIIQTGSINASASRALPCNVKVLAVAVELEDTTPGTPVPGGTLGLNVSSGLGPTGATVLVSGTLTVAGTTAGLPGTANLTIVGPTPGTSQSTSASIVPTQTPSTIALNLVQAINNAPNTQVFAAAVAGVITLWQLVPQNLLAQLGGQQTFQGAITGTTGITISPTVPTAFPTNPNSAQVGTPDNFATSTPSSAFAGAGQFVFGKFRTMSYLTGPIAPNFVQYSGIASSGLPGQNPVTLAEYDIILPCTRGITIWLPNLSGINNAIANVSALVMPVILDPNQPYPVAGMWQPNNTNLGAPSTA